MSKIEWTDKTWNPVTGCTKISTGCKNCYAEKMAERWRGIPGHPYEQGFDLKLWPDRINDPIKWKKPRMIFVNSMSDLFHEDVPDEFIAQVFQTMAKCKQHTFQILTKRPERMKALLGGDSWMRGRVGRDAWCDVDPKERQGNVWLGVSVEDQYLADERISLLLETPAAVRFLSCEPLLGPLNLKDVEVQNMNISVSTKARINCLTDMDDEHFYNIHNKLDWVIVGGESGMGSRPMDIAWARSIRDQCESFGVPFFMKQLGGSRYKRGKLTDIPEDLRIREWPLAFKASGENDG